MDRCRCITSAGSQAFFWTVLLSATDAKYQEDFGMKLIIGGDPVEGEVTNGLIERTIWGLTGDGDSFVILEKSEMHYMQTSGDMKNGFVLEYQEGALDEHFTCTDEPVDAKRVIEALQSYLAQDRKWLTKCNWEKDERSSSSGISTAAVLAVLGLIIVIVALMMWQSA